MSGYKLLYKKLNKIIEYQNFSPNMRKHFCCFVVVLVKSRIHKFIKKIVLGIDNICETTLVVVAIGVRKLRSQQTYSLAKY